jgi:hypothetical protein
MASMRPFGFPGGADPFRELRRLQEEMDRLAGAFTPAAASLHTRPPQETPLDLPPEGGG